jgi:AAA+ ATPase superfamily predicted ATPase
VIFHPPVLKETPNNLPVQLTSFIGREKEVEHIEKRLERNRLVTLTGSGGVGKTRLSIQVASELLDEFPNGVWLVELHRSLIQRLAQAYAPHWM